MITVLSGGTGTPKLLQGLARVVGQEKITVIVNTAEDTEISGLYVSPDVDTVVYTLAGIVNEETWYGVAGDSFRCHEMMGRLGRKELLRIGDLDRGIKLYRTIRMREGASLSEITEEICRSLGVRARVLPMTNDRVRTVVHTVEGDMSFHEFWVARRAKVDVRGVSFENIKRARPAEGVIESIRKSDRVIIGPSNPITSILPILSVGEVGQELERVRERVMAVSPIVGGAPLSGPAGVLMKTMGYEVSPVGVARIYGRFACTLFIDERDAALVGEVSRMGMKAEVADLMMPDLSARERLARRVLSVIPVG